MQTIAPRLEQERLNALLQLEILDTPPEREFDDLTQLASLTLRVESAAVSLIDDHRQWFKARTGIPFASTPRDIAFCNHAIGARELLVVSDASVDPRFANNPLVTAPGGIRFYAGVPLIMPSGYCVGTLCVFDPTPRAILSEHDVLTLRKLAALAADLIQTGRSRRMSEIVTKVVEATPDSVIAADMEGKIVYWNAAAETMFGRSAKEALGKPIELIIPRRLAVGHEKMFARAAEGGETRLVGTSVELVAARADGSEFPVELSLTRWGRAGERGGFAAIVRDITKRRAGIRERERAQQFLDTIIENLPAMLFVKDTVTRQYVLVNRAGEEMIGRSSEEIIGHTDAELFAEGAGYAARDTEAIAADGPCHFESVYRRPDGTAVHLRTTRAVIDGPDRTDQYLLGVSEDVTQTRLAEAEVRRLAHFDSLTGLLNRASFTERLERTINARVPFVMLSIDLDRFKAINDQFGHLVGDEVLVEVGRRLHACLGPRDWIARVGGDEFVAVLLGADMRKRAGDLSHCVIEALCEPIRTERATVHAGGSVGVVAFPEDGACIDTIREHVDLALYRAKADGRGRVCFFNVEMDAEARDRRKLEKDLRHAIAEDEIALFYQPIMDVRSGATSSVEALARWTHPDRGPVGPDIFIALAEECGLINALGRRLLQRACADATQWDECIRVAVNLSPLQFLSGTLVEDVRKALEQSGITPDRLQLEVTENLVIRDVEGTFAQLEELRSLGIQILMDDFGVGYSSLSYFQRFPFDKVKLDKSFVDEVTTSRPAKAIIQAVVNLGRELGMGVVAEGVETEAQKRALIDCGCTHLQGYLIAKPLAVPALNMMLGAGRDEAMKTALSKQAHRLANGAAGASVIGCRALENLLVRSGTSTPRLR